MFNDTSREDTTRIKFRFLSDVQVELGSSIDIGSATWLRKSLTVKVAETPKEKSSASHVVRKLHYLCRWPVPPQTKFVQYVASIKGMNRADGHPAGVVMVALLAGNFHAMPALNAGLDESDPAWIHPCSALTIVRMWRADDLDPKLAPDFTPEMLRRVIKGDKHGARCKVSPCNCVRSLKGIREEWLERKVHGSLVAEPKIVFTYADVDGVGHDGNTYVSSGATFCGPAKCGKWLFAWGLTPDVKANLKRYGAAVRERLEESGWTFNPFPNPPMKERD